jgi:hypothetical protein
MTTVCANGHRDAGWSTGEDETWFCRQCGAIVAEVA